MAVPVARGRSRTAMESQPRRCLRRPLVDRIQGGRYHHMKELRPPSSGAGTIRMLFAFDPTREAIFLIAGDKSGAWGAGTARRFHWPTSDTPNT